MTFTETTTNGKEPAASFAPPPPDEPTASPRRPRVALAVVASIGLVGIFLVAILVGRDAGSRSLPARRTSTSPAVGGAGVTAPSSESTASTDTATTLTPVPGSEGVDFFTTTKADLTGQGCNGEVTFSWTFQPEKVPPPGTDAVVIVTGPNSSDTYHASTAAGALKLTAQVPLQEGGMWTAVVQSVGNQTAYPLPISMTLSGVCF